MKIVADYDRCEGHGLCEAAAAQVYRLDDDGELIILAGEADELPQDLEKAAAAGARACPVAALRIEV